MYIVRHFALLGALLTFCICPTSGHAEAATGNTEVSDAKTLFFTSGQDFALEPAAAIAPPPAKPTAKPVRVASSGTASKRKNNDHVGMRIQLSKIEADGRETPVSTKFVFTSGDRFRMIVTPNKESFVYVYNQYNEYPETLIYPRPEEQAVRAKAMQPIVLPAQGKSFKLDVNKPGVERMKVILAAEPIAPKGSGQNMVASDKSIPDDAKFIAVDDEPVATPAAAAGSPAVLPAIYVTTSSANLKVGSQYGQLVHQFELLRK